MVYLILRHTNWVKMLNLPAVIFVVVVDAVVVLVVVVVDIVVVVDVTAEKN